MGNINKEILPKSFVDGNAIVVDPVLAEAVAAGIQGKLAHLPPPERERFLALTANLAPADVDTPEELGQVLDAFEAAARRLAEDPELGDFVGEIASFLARALIRFLGEQRQQALEGRLLAYDAARVLSLEQAGKMEDAAEKQMTGAIVNVTVGSASNAVSALSSLGSAGLQAKQAATMGKGIADTASKAGEANKIANDIDTLGRTMISAKTPGERAALQNLMPGQEALLQAKNHELTVAGQKFSNANTISNVAQSFGQGANQLAGVGEAGGRGADQSLQAEAKKDDAEGARNAAESAHAQKAAETGKEQQQSLEEMIKQLINFIKELDESRVQTMAVLSKV